ncbi:hypothetical protein SanaruYs_18370 [Chryseotalea sanaruensis]|uniref:Tetratricopeptide repeat protein n=1 Tax=Chryseotalea sanaruensis TaxID=2482724 RepID=A0A401U9Q3_9BACT|nr:hypothetical protein [Chryseotalea sanaruensis]GCC51610.1 hypothetical protein SanaruYs_18370 [Chryseotalea sanaruensis]
MNKLWFWKTWNTSYKQHTYLLMTLMVISFVFFAFYYFKGVDSVIGWENFQEQKIVETSIHEFQLGPFEITVPVNVYLLFEFFQGGKLQPNLYISYVFVLVLTIAFVYLVTIFSALEKFWYFIASGLVILFLVSLRLDVLQVAGLGNSWFTIGTIAVFLLPSFYFNAFNKTATFQFRLLIFALITLLVSIVIYFMAGVKLPFMYLSVTAYVPAMVLTVIFIVMVAHEVPAGFLYLTTQAQASTGLKHFLVITIIYLLNLVLIYGNDQGFITWNILYLDIYLIFSVTVFIGFWGWKHREVLYQGLMPFYPFGAYFYLAMASIALITFAFLFGTSNDAPLEALRDILVFCHLGFGLILLLYVFSNFLKLIDRDLSAWKVLYRPNRMPYETFRLGGIIVVVSLMIYNDWKSYVNNSFSGFWTSMADLYVAIGEEDVAQLYYEQGRTYGYANHHANYAKGYYYSGEFQWQQSHDYYTRANLKRPSAYALANDANVYNWEENNFKSIFSLKDALKQLPDDPYLTNNLGLFKGKIHELDSSFFLLGASRNYAKTKNAAETNFTGIVATELLPISPDSLASLFKTENKGVNANLLGLSAITRMPLNKEINVMKEGVLTLHEATLLHNFILAKSLTITATELDKAEVLARDSVNLDYAEALKVALAHAHYLQGNVARALQLMSELSFVSASNQGKYNFVIGLWLLEQGDPEAAALAFRYAFNYNYKDAQFYMAIAETESGNLGDALILWEKLLSAADEGERSLANTITQVLSMNLQEAIKSTDAIKYQYSRYRLSTRDTTMLTVLVNSMEEANYKAQSLTEMAVRQLEADRPATAQRYIQEALSLSVNSPAVRTFRQFTQLRVLASLGELDALATQLSDVTFSLNRKLDKMYYEGLLNDAGGEKALADKAFAQLAHANPFFEEGVITAAEYARKFSKDNGEAYAILSEAVQVNKSSVRLWKAYIGEALRLGYDDYAADARISLQRLMLK